MIKVATFCFFCFFSEAGGTGCFFLWTLTLENKVGDVTEYKVKRLLNRVSAASFCAGLDLGWRWPETACGVFVPEGLIVLRFGRSLLGQVS